MSALQPEVDRAPPWWPARRRSSNPLPCCRRRWRCRPERRPRPARAHRRGRRPRVARGAFEEGWACASPRLAYIASATGGSARNRRSAGRAPRNLPRDGGEACCGRCGARHAAGCERRRLLPSPRQRRLLRPDAVERGLRGIRPDRRERAGGRQPCDRQREHRRHDHRLQVSEPEPLQPDQVLHGLARPARTRSHALSERGELRRHSLADAQGRQRVCVAAQLARDPGLGLERPSGSGYALPVAAQARAVGDRLRPRTARHRHVRARDLGQAGAEIPRPARLAHLLRELQPGRRPHALPADRRLVRAGIGPAGELRPGRTRDRELVDRYRSGHRTNPLGGGRVRVRPRRLLAPGRPGRLRPRERRHGRPRRLRPGSASPLPAERRRRGDRPDDRRDGAGAAVRPAREGEGARRLRRGSRSGAGARRLARRAPEELRESTRR